jgi:hypothetical protein
VPPQRLLTEPAWPGVTSLVIGVGWLLLDLLGGGLGLRTVVASAFVALGSLQLVRRHTVLDELGITLPGSFRGRIRWADVVSVGQSRMALHHQDVELVLRGDRSPVRLKERHGGRDFEAVHAAWSAYGTPEDGTS